MLVGSCGRLYKVSLCFEKLLSCTKDEVTFIVVYYKSDTQSRRLIKKTLEKPKFEIIVEGGWIYPAGDDYQINLQMEEFFKQCNFTFLNYEHTIDYCRTEISHYLLLSLGIYIADDLIWYVLFSTPYSLYNYSQNLTNLKYKRQYHYGYMMEKK